MSALNDTELAAVSSTELMALPPAQCAALALKSEQTRKDLIALVATAATITQVNSGDGREQAHRVGMTLKSARVSVEKIGKSAREDATAFSKAVIAEEKALVALVEPEEARVLGLRDEWDAKIEVERQAKIAAERARVDAIQARMTVVRNLPAATVGKSAADISQMIYELVGTISEDDAYAATFEEFADDFKALRTDTLELLAQAERKQLDIEAAARAAEAERKAELQALADQKAEQAKVAAAQAAKEKELADAAAELQRQRDKDAATARAAQLEAERMAKVEADKVAAQRAKEAKELADARAALEQEQAEFKRKQDKATAAAALYTKMGKHYEAALTEDAERTAARIAEKQAMVDEAIAVGHEQAADERIAGLPAGALGFDAMADALDTDEAHRKAVLECAMKAVANDFGITHPEAIAELRLIEPSDFDAAEVLAEAA